MIGLLAQSTSGTQQTGGALTLLFPLILMGGVFYFILIRPQRRRAQQQQALLSDLEVGDEIMTGGGIFGTVTDIDDDEGTVDVEIAEGVTVHMLKAGVSRRLVDEDYNEEDDEDEDEGGDDHEEGADATS